MRYAISVALLSLQLLVSIALAQFSPSTVPTTSSSAPTTTPAEREQIGTCQGIAVYRDQIAVTADKSLTEELHRLLLHRPMETYYAAHKAALVPSDAEIEFTMKFFMEKQEEMLEERLPEFRARLPRIEEELADPKLDETTRKRLENEKYNINYELTARDKPQYAEAARSFWTWWLER